ncbi:hypothetical protein H5410_048926 [Solanum commersonii]|uniref:Uncharacterized protein n=1 Tax=Solanum commersonii TaxID=4109 RepID=A0A9J5XME1_SOLCO|nr:hypothetical protein H5410_048926 [Solanum commersonii]
MVDAFNVNGTGSYILVSKLRMLKQKLKEWRVTHRNNWKQRKEEILQQLADLEKTQELRLLSEDELLQKVHLAMEIATAHKRHNSIDTLLVEGNLISDPEEIKREITSFYKKLYTETEQWRPDFKLQGLSVNWRKSSMFPVKDVTNIQCLANILSCKIEYLPTTYLGMPLGNNHKELEIWDGIVEKTEKKLATWKTQYLSLGGINTLINAVLDALPTYGCKIYLYYQNGCGGLVKRIMLFGRMLSLANMDRLSNGQPIL